MKKIIAIVLSIVVLFTLSAVAFAAENSPESGKKITITIRAAVDQDGKMSVDKAYSFAIENGIVKLTANTSFGTFNSWSIYKAGTDGKSTGLASEGVDYAYISGTSTNSSVQIQAMTDVIICANYNGATTNPDAVSSGNTSPATSDMAVVFAVVSMLSAAAVVFSAKKVFSK